MVTYASIVKGATKIKLAPPKEKYLTPILIGCSSSSSSKDAQDILFLLHKRLSDSAFTICYKSLIVLHYILNECNNSDNRKLLKYVYNEFLNGSSKKDYYCRASESDLMALKRYKEYLFARISIINPAHLEVLKENNSNTNSKNKIQIEQIINTIKLEIECIGKLLKNKYSIHDLTNTNNLLLTCFKLLTNDLLVLYNILNEGIITILESFFELKLELQKETCELYDDFVMITEDVVKYLKIGKQCGLSIPVIKHITTKLGKSLREHLESTENVNNSNSTGKSSNGNALSAKEQLENVRKQRQLLESQLRMTSNDLSTPQKTQFTGFSSQQ
ncbi:GAT-like domain-containing protein, partial [Hanseniaspora valbyensis NRRL Y-1626]